VTSPQAYHRSGSWPFPQRELLAWRSDESGVNDLAAHGKKVLGHQGLVEAAEQPLDGAGLLELVASVNVVEIGV
jgi:hypothetical protein